MRTSPFVLTSAAAVALFARTTFAEDPAAALPSRIARVTVYEDRALVTRTARASVAAGVTRVAVEHLPPGLDAASVRARCSAGRVLGVDLETVHLVHEAREDLQKATAAHDAARRKLAAADMELAEAKDRWELLRSIRAKGVEGAERALGGSGGADVSALRKLLELVGEEGVAARKAVLAATDAFEAARAEEDAARRRLESLRTGADRVESRVVVTLESDAAAVGDLAVQYMVGNATWHPVYDLRVDEQFGGASLGLSGVVSQRTGEDWSGVALELTTAQPSAGASPPEPQAWRISFPKRYAAKGLAAPSAGPVEREVALGDTPVAGAKLDDFRDAAMSPRVRRSGVVVAFEAPASESVASDGQPSRVTLARFDLAPTVRWNAFPRVTDKVFVTAKMRNTATVPLPAGEMRVFVGADYVGPMALADWGIGKEIDVGLGVDREVEVERERIGDERSTEGLFTKDTVTTRAFRLTLRNHRARAIDVRLLDQVPVSDDEDLVVKLLETNLDLASLPDREAETNKARGILEWRFRVAPQSQADVRFSFEVRHPRGREPVGLGE